jgi:hypothetical protein
MRSIKIRRDFVRKLVLGIWALLGLWATKSELQAQQFPISDIYIASPLWMNPAGVGVDALNKVFLSHQQRNVAWGNWRSISQFLNYSTGPIGSGQNFGFGFRVNNDIEHTEQRLSINLAFAAHVLKTNNHTLSLGMNLGLINWGSNYGLVRVVNSDDVLLAKNTGFVDLDAGLGIRYAYKNYFIKSEVNGVLSQIPGNLVSKTATAFDLEPHILAGGSALLTPDNNFFLGPLLFYRNTIFGSDIDTTLGLESARLVRGQLDVGAKMELEQQGLWVSAAYRINNAALTTGFGLKLLNPDTLFQQSHTAVFLSLNAMGSYPLNGSSIFGPSFEVGAILSFGHVGETVNRPDTLRPVRGSFWKDDGNINNHLGNRLSRNAPAGLGARTLVGDKNVTLNYRWADDMYVYVGDKPQPVQDTLLSAVGREWTGVDGILGNLVTEVIREALRPDTAGVLFPDSLEPLKDLISIEIGSNLAVDELAADFGAQGTIYEGNLPENGSSDTIMMRVIYNGRDTVIQIFKDQHLSNLQLACLKLHSMRKKLEYELNKYFGTNMAFIWEGQKLNDDIVAGRKVVYLKPPVITPNNPNQKTFQVTEVTMNFTRYPNYFANRDLEEKEKSKGKNNTQKEARKRRNAYRDLVE